MVRIKYSKLIIKNAQQYQNFYFLLKNGLLNNVNIMYNRKNLKNVHLIYLHDKGKTCKFK